MRALFKLDTVHRQRQLVAQLRTAAFRLRRQRIPAALPLETRLLQPVQPGIDPGDLVELPQHLRQDAFFHGAHGDIGVLRVIVAPVLRSIGAVRIGPGLHERHAAGSHAAGRGRLGARTLRSDRDASEPVDTRDRAAASPDFHHLDDRDAQRQSAALHQPRLAVDLEFPGPARFEVLDEADLRRGSAHVKGHHLLHPGPGGDVACQRHADRRAVSIVASPPPNVISRIGQRSPRPATSSSRRARYPSMSGRI